MMLHCEGKKPYSTPAAASKAARGRKLDGVTYLRVYQCQACGAFHLTSSKPEQYESKRKEHGQRQ